MNVRHFLLIFLLLVVSSTATFAQSDKDWWKMADDKSRRTAEAERSVSNGPSRGRAALDATDNTPETASVKLARADTFIVRDSTVFVDEMGGFEHYLMAAMRKKSVGLIVVADPTQADYIIFGSSDSKRAGWAKMVFLGDGRSGEMASISMVNRKTKVVMFADSSHRYGAYKGKRSTAEKLAKYLGKKIKQDEKRMKTIARP